MLTIFLDVGGVLRLYTQPVRTELHPGCIKRLNTLLSALEEYQLILSASWRVDYGMEFTYQTMVRFGYTGKRFTATTPILGHNKQPRGEEIRNYMHANGLNTEQILILDDLALDQDLAVRQVKTNHDFGLTPKLLKKALVLCQKS